MWDTILSTYREVLSSAEGSYSAKANSEGARLLANADGTGYNCSSEENEVALAALQARAWLALRKKLEEQTTDATVLGTLRSTFEERFRYDEGGVPRVWKPEDDIEAAFKKAKDEVGLIKGDYGLTWLDTSTSSPLRDHLPLRAITPTHTAPTGVVPRRGCRSHSLRPFDRLHPLVRHQAALPRDPVQARRGRRLCRGKTEYGVFHRADPTVDVRRARGARMERGDGRFVQPAVLCHAPRAGSFSVSDVFPSLFAGHD